ncbi:hypothetical protein B0A48_10912 [Cryoendolithus antarcticus]|uniref:Uncharacterized protein n=1 Tax=Cryoendolithus antarcticus TaxID=1507870 RepID=A0A1V8SZ51_9PEZI|nr:hypothetical protein B0A48_10912 [Cryoendolithus antarcticus]
MKLLTLALLLATSTSAQPTAAPQLTAANIIAIAPSTASCAGSVAQSECRTAAQAAPWLTYSFSNFGHSAFSTQAALLSLILYETANFTYSVNHYPGVPGQGTRNMQSPAFNLLYAKWLSESCKNCRLSAAQVANAEGASVEAVLDLVNGDEFGFGSAAWFLATQCTADVRAALATGTAEGWEAYMGCVGAQAGGERQAIWEGIIGLGHW